MTTDPQPAHHAGLPDEGEPPTADLVPVASRPLDLFHDEMMAKAAAAHEKRMAAGQEDRAAVLDEAAAECHQVAAIYAKREMHEASDAVAAMGIRLRRMAAVPAGSADAGHTSSYETTTGHLITCLGVAGGASDPDCPACPPAVVAQPAKEA
jgi:hypothetical protein